MGDKAALFDLVAKSSNSSFQGNEKSFEEAS